MVLMLFGWRYWKSITVPFRGRDTESHSCDPKADIKHDVSYK
jgi:hypothetical protein